MDKEKVTEELVRQNGNQAAAVMADYASQGGGGGQVNDFGNTKNFAFAEKLTQEEVDTVNDLNSISAGKFTYVKIKKEDKLAKAIVFPVIMHDPLLGCTDSTYFRVNEETNEITVVGNNDVQFVSPNAGEENKTGFVFTGMDENYMYGVFLSPG